MHHDRFAGYRFYDRDTPLSGEIGQLRDSARIVNTPAGDDQGLARLGDHGGCGGSFPGVGRRTPDIVDPLGEKGDGIVVSLRLDILGKGEESRSAVGRVQHHPQRLGEGWHDLLGAGDAIPVPGDRAEGVAH